MVTLTSSTGISRRSRRRRRRRRRRRSCSSNGKSNEEPFDFFRLTYPNCSSSSTSGVSFSSGCDLDDSGGSSGLSSSSGSRSKQQQQCKGTILEEQPTECWLDPVYLEDLRVFENLMSKENAELLRRSQLLALANSRSSNEAAEQQQNCPPVLLLLPNKQRHSLLSWMLSVCDQQLCQDDIFPLASMILDKFLLCKPLLLGHSKHDEQGNSPETETETETEPLQLIERQLYLFGACALLLASKLRQTPRLCTDSLLAFSKAELHGQALCKEELLEGELLMLGVLKWDLVALVPPNDFLALLLGGNRSTGNSLSSLIKASQPARLRRHIQTLLELCLMDSHLSQIPPSIMAMASMAVAIQGLSTNEKTCPRLQEIVTQIHEATHKVNELKLMIDVAFQIEKYVQKLLNSTHTMIE